MWVGGCGGIVDTATEVSTCCYGRKEGHLTHWLQSTEWIGGLKAGSGERIKSAE